jgi:yeast amino acid transporter
MVLPSFYPFCIVLTWCRGSICYAHIRFRRAWKLQGYNVEDLPFRAAAGVYGSWFGLLLNILCLIAQFYVALFPIGGSPDAKSFFEAYLAAPIVLFFFIGWKLYKRTRFVRSSEVDLVSGRRLMNLSELKIQEREEQEAWGPWKRYFLFLGWLIEGFIIGFVRPRNSSWGKGDVFVALLCCVL